MEEQLSILINDTNLPVKEYNGQRVVTLKEIDQVHKRPDGTARKRFNDNKEHFIEGTDYFKVSASDFRTHLYPGYSKQVVEDITLITESGYLMLVKSFTDDLAWTVQRQLVNTYFRVHDAKSSTAHLSPELKMFKAIFDSIARTELQQLEQRKAISDVNQRLVNIRDVVTLSPNSWRPETRSLINSIAKTVGGIEYIREVQHEIFKLVDERAGVSLETRLTNKRRRMAEEGACKSKRDKLNKVDVIAEDKKLIEIYIAVVKDMALHYGVDVGVAV